MKTIKSKKNKHRLLYFPFFQLYYNFYSFLMCFHLFLFIFIVIQKFKSKTLLIIILTIKRSIKNMKIIES